MIDNSFRALLPQYTKSITKLFKTLKLTPNHISWLGFFIAIISAYFVFKGFLFYAALVWWLSRILDACDGIYAREYGLTSKFGAFLDIQLDMAAYSLMIVAFYFQFPEQSLQWIFILLLYVLCITGALSLGSFEKEVGLEDNSGRGLQLAAGLAEAGETGIMYTIFLLFPSWLGMTSWIWVGILMTTVIARYLLAKQQLR